LQQSINSAETTLNDIDAQGHSFNWSFRKHNGNGGWLQWQWRCNRAQESAVILPRSLEEWPEPPGRTSQELELSLGCRSGDRHPTTQSGAARRHQHKLPKHCSPGRTAVMFAWYQVDCAATAATRR
jgi:hypothetical protein